MQPELVRYYHAVVGFPTKPTWVAVIKNRQFALWLGLTAKAFTKHFLELEETAKGYATRQEAASAQQRLQLVMACTVTTMTTTQHPNLINHHAQQQNSAKYT
jgi:hypothetical protein